MTGSTQVHQSRARLSYSLSYQQDQIAKKTEQMTALLLLSNALSPMRLDESRRARDTEERPAEMVDLFLEVHVRRACGERIDLHLPPLTRG